MMKMICLFLLLIGISQAQQNITYNDANDGRCSSVGGGCYFSDPTIWTGGVVPGVNATVWIQTLSPISISVNFSTPYLYHLHLIGNVTVLITATGNLSTNALTVNDTCQIVIQNGILYGDVAHFHDSSFLSSSGGQIELATVYEAKSTTMNGTVFIGFAFSSDIFYCQNCNFTALILASSVLNFTGQLTGTSIQDANITGITTNMIINGPIIEDISLYSGTAFISNAQVTGNLNLGTANITFYNTTIQTPTVTAVPTSNIILMASSFVVTQYILRPTIIAGPSSHLTFIGTGSIAELIQLDVNDENANLPILLFCWPGYIVIDGSVNPIFLRSSVIFVDGSELRLVGNVTLYPVNSSSSLSSSSSSLAISGYGTLHIGAPGLTTFVNFTAPLSVNASNVIVKLSQATLTAEGEVGQLTVAHNSSVIGSIAADSLVVEAPLTVTGDLIVSESYVHHLINGYTTVNGTLLIEGLLTLVEDGSNTLFDLNSEAGNVEIAYAATSIVDVALTIMQAYDQYFYDSERFYYNLITSETQMTLQFAFQEPMPTPTPNPPYYLWDWNWKWYCVLAAVCIGVGALIRVFRWQQRRDGYQSINS